jgi:hypothetical protein
MQKEASLQDLGLQKWGQGARQGEVGEIDPALMPLAPTAEWAGPGGTRRAVLV